MATHPAAPPSEDGAAPPAVRPVPIGSLRPAPWNPRLIRDERFLQLCRSLEADPGFLWQRPVLASADGTIYAGNMRYRAAEHLGWREIPAIIADVPEHLAKERALRDNNAWGEWQDDALAEVLAGLKLGGSDLDLLGFEDARLAELLALSGVEGEQADPTYTGRIESPIYEITGPKPEVGSLFDEEQTRTLLSEIEAAEGLSEEERRFLIVAAQRHTVLHFGRIAEYYAHAPAHVQALMERSALVIIDFNRAIELGYVRLGEAVSELYRQDYPDAE